MSLRRDTVLAALKEAGDPGVSGEALAQQIGVSRAAIAKHIAALRRLGYDIEAHAGSGYSLVSIPDLALAEEIRPLLSSRMWVDLIGHEDTVSTNDDAKKLARDGAPQGTVVLANKQQGGRGRLGREWESPVGGVYLSAVLRPDTPLADLAPLPLVVALGVVKGLSAIGVEAGLKWPNDVWYEGGKLAGVLLETSAESDRAEWVVAGVGINIHRPPEPFEGASYMDSDLRLPLVAAHVLDGIAETYERFGIEGFSALVAEYEEHSILVGREVGVSHVDGTLIAEGLVTGFDALGRLMLKDPASSDGDDGDIRAVSAGDVTLRKDSSR